MSPNTHTPFHLSFHPQSSTRATIFRAHIHFIHTGPTASHQLQLPPPAPLHFTEDWDCFSTARKALILGRVPAPHRLSTVSLTHLATGAASVSSLITHHLGASGGFGECIVGLIVCVCLCVPRRAYECPLRQMQRRRTGFNTQLEANSTSSRELMKWKWRSGVWCLPETLFLQSCGFEENLLLPSRARTQIPVHSNKKKKTQHFSLKGFYMQFNVTAS